MSPSPRSIAIIGASSGVGRATAHAFAAAGFHLVPAARRRVAAEACRGPGTSGPAS
ncbi:hypothetical protein [Roseococcus thiosulfatophilus]|uniref:hypothetical protein n=1 Tax=Roseococcus thiosulfatophilus TaxID=35813 RepID=UPI001A8DB278|nr:hypothetical protein [Roseococcus thiosulfatophilus]